MLKPTVKRGLMLDFIPDEIILPAEINQNRIFKLNNNEVLAGDIVYLMSRELRLEDNWAVVLGVELAKKYNANFKIVVDMSNITCSEVQKPFLNNGLEILKQNAVENKVDFEIVEKLPKNIGTLIVDFNPINLQDKFAKDVGYAVYEVDSHNIIPSRFISDKQEFSAATLRRKVYANLADFLTEFPKYFQINDNIALNNLHGFTKTKLDSYVQLKNDPNKDTTSKMSPYLHFGFISAQRIALEVIQSSASRDNKEAFLEELIVRKELSDNFCLHNKDYKTLDSVPNWAKETLNIHKSDIRTYLYDLDEFEHGKTHDKLWNKIQQNLLSTGRIHGYLRMYWAKKILEWSKSPEEALKIAIYLNDTYATDGNDANGYVGILWSIGGIHDRAFSNRMVFGKIRYMSLSGCEKKFDVKKYIEC